MPGPGNPVSAGSLVWTSRSRGRFSTDRSRGVTHPPGSEQHSAASRVAPQDRYAVRGADLPLNLVGDPARTSHHHYARRSLHDAYAEGEALLGWLNTTLRLSAGKPFDGNRLLVQVAGQISRRLSAESIEIAHLKMTLTPNGETGELGALHLVGGVPRGRVAVQAETRIIRRGTDPELASRGSS